MRLVLTGPFFKYMINEVILPALMDYDGILVLSGTPSPLANGLFYENAHDTKGIWSSYHWTVMENQRFPRWKGDPHWKKKATKMLAEAKKDNHPIKFKREWLRRMDS